MRTRGTVASVLAAAAAAALLLTAPPVSASGRVRVPTSLSADHRAVFPDTVALPNGFQPEGVTVRGATLFAGSLIDGDIYTADVITGKGRRLVDAPAGRTALGLKADNRGRLFVAGGPLGAAYVYDIRTGAPLAHYQPGPAGSSLLNDDVIVPGGVYFTDSSRPVLYRLPLGRNGALPTAAETLRLTGPAADDVTAGQFNLNGIVYASWAHALVVVNSYTGGLYRIDPQTGQSSRIDLGGQTLTNGDGLVLLGRRLFVVQNLQNKVTPVELDARLTRGEVVEPITDPRFRIPSTAGSFGPYLYVVNARFDVAPPPFGGTPPADPTLTYDVVRVRALTAAHSSPHR